MKAKSSKAKTLTSKAMKKTKGGLAAGAIEQGKLQESLSATMDQSFATPQDSATLNVLRRR
ncbi:MAG TPA: hypothetical protein VMA09_00265 [Candidatus Binataceae bacterium]|nr:hypothetical protein [Candidatus Binataceae bacterium]